MSNTPIADVATPDPFMLRWNDRFLLTFSLGNRIEIWSSAHMEDFRGCQKSLIWQPSMSPDAQWTAAIWAPELHHIDGIWFVYFCGERPKLGNASHRILICCSRDPDPMKREAWEFIGPMKGVPDHWAIDATVFKTDAGALYCCYSGWPLGDSSDTQQDLFLIKLASPEVAIAETLVCISRAELPWERTDGGRRGINEGPEWVSLPGFQGLVYSANGSWTCDYQLGLLQLVGPNPLDATCWRKRRTPFMVSDRRHPPYGPGHASFINSPHGDGKVYCIYHGTGKPNDGWADRKARVLLLGPECFRLDAPPVCCADPYRRTGGMQAQIGYPGNQSGHGPPPHAEQKGFIERIGDTIRKTLGEL